MKELENKNQQKTENSKRVSMRFYVRAEDSLRLEELFKTLRKRGWKKETERLSDLIIDELFLKAGAGFYKEALNKFTPLEYLFKTKINNPALRKEMEKILKKKF